MFIPTSAYDANFAQKCNDHGLHGLTDLGEKPENWRELHAKLATRRPSLSPSQSSDEAFRRYSLAEGRSRIKKDTIRESLPYILGEKRPDYHSAWNILFRNMDAIAAPPKEFKTPKPDLYWGAQPAQIDLQVRRDLKPLIFPSTRDSNPAAPNFFLEVKGPDGSRAANKRQACYVGALGARAMQALQDYGQAESRHDRKAYALSSTYCGGELTLYSHHVAQPQHPDKSAEYHMAQLGVWQLRSSSQSFREGLAAFRNAIDFAQEKRNMLIDKANTVARTQSRDATVSMDESDPLNMIASRQGRNTSVVDLVDDSIISGSDQLEGTPPRFTFGNHHTGTLGPWLMFIACFVTLSGIVIWFWCYRKDIY